MEEMQIEAGTVMVIPESPVDRLIAEIEAKPDATYPGTVVASMLRLVMSLSGPHIVDARKGRRTEAQRQRIAEGVRKAKEKRAAAAEKGRDDVSDVKTFPSARRTDQPGDARPGVAAVAGNAAQ